MGTFWEMVNQQDPQNRQTNAKDMKEENKVHPEFEVLMKYNFSLVRLLQNTAVFSILII